MVFCRCCSSTLQRCRVGMITYGRKCALCHDFLEEGELCLQCPQKQCRFNICCDCAVSNAFVQTTLCRHPRGLQPSLSSFLGDEERECCICEADFTGDAHVRTCLDCRASVCARCCLKLDVDNGPSHSTNACRAGLTGGCGHPQGLWIDSSPDFYCNVCLSQYSYSAAHHTCNSCNTTVCLGCVDSLGKRNQAPVRSHTAAGGRGGPQVAAPVDPQDSAATKKWRGKKGQQPLQQPLQSDTHQPRSSGSAAGGGRPLSSQTQTGGQQHQAGGGGQPSHGKGGGQQNRGQPAPAETKPPRDVAAAGSVSEAAPGPSKGVASSNVFHPGDLTGRKLQIFWDMENCQMRRAGLSPQQHFDLLCTVFIKICGVKSSDICLHAVMSAANQERLSVADRDNLNRRNSLVRLYSPLGKSVQKGGNDKARKEDLHGVDVVVIDQMERYHNDARPDDVLVLIAGDGGYMDSLRKAAFDKHLQVFLLSPENATDKELLSNRFIVKWHAFWVPFVNHYCAEIMGIAPCPGGNPGEAAVSSRGGGGGRGDGGGRQDSSRGGRGGDNSRVENAGRGGGGRGDGSGAGGSGRGGRGGGNDHGGGDHGGGRGGGGRGGRGDGNDYGGGRGGNQGGGRGGGGRGGGGGGEGGRGGGGGGGRGHKGGDAQVNHIAFGMSTLDGWPKTGNIARR